MPLTAKSREHGHRYFLHCILCALEAEQADRPREAAQWLGCAQDVLDALAQSIQKAAPCGG